MAAEIASGDGAAASWSAMTRGLAVGAVAVDSRRRASALAAAARGLRGTGRHARATAASSMPVGRHQASRSHRRRPRAAVIWRGWPAYVRVGCRLHQVRSGRAPESDAAGGARRSLGVPRRIDERPSRGGAGCASARAPVSRLKRDRASSVRDTVGLGTERSTRCRGDEPARRSCAGASGGDGEAAPAGGGRDARHREAPPAGPKDQAEVPRRDASVAAGKSLRLVSVAASAVVMTGASRDR